jgi:hypothetical protein
MAASDAPGTSPQAQIRWLYRRWRSAKRWRTWSWILFFVPLIGTKSDVFSLQSLYQLEMGKVTLGVILILTFSIAVSSGLKEWVARRKFERQFFDEQSSPL